MADRIILSRTNTELLAANTRRAQRTGLQYDGQGARVLSLEDVEKRRQLAERKKKIKRPKYRQKNRNRTIGSFSRYQKTLCDWDPI